MLRAQTDVDSGMPDPVTPALALLRRAIALEPRYALAHGNAAMCHHCLDLHSGMREHARIAVEPAREGVLTSTIDVNTTFDAADFRNGIPRFAPEAWQANLALVDVLRGIAGRHGATPAQVALAWLLARKPWIVPLFGTRKLERLDENLGALSVGLTATDAADIQTAVAAIAIQGDRYPPDMMARSGL